MRGIIVYTECASDGACECILSLSVFGPVSPRAAVSNGRVLIALIQVRNIAFNDV